MEMYGFYELTNISSVLLSLSLCMLTVPQALTSLMHDCMGKGNLEMLSGGAGISNCRSSASFVRQYVDQ